MDHIRNKSLPALLFFCLLAVVTVGRLIFIGLAPPSGDELYVWQAARHPDWCYNDIPLLVPSIMRFTTSVFGHTTLGIRFMSPIYAALTGLILFLWGRRITGNPWTGFTAGTLYLIMPATALGGVYAATDTALAFFWFLATYSFWRATAGGTSGAWYATGLFLLLGCLSKYLMIFWVPGAALYLLTRPKCRVWLLRPQPYLVLAIGALSAVPFIVWNVRNDWSAFTFQVAGRHTLNPTLRYVGEMLGGQIALASPIIFGCVVAAVVWVIRKRRRSEINNTIELVAMFALITPAILACLGLLVRVSPFWPGVGYSLAALLVALWVTDSGTQAKAKRTRQTTLIAGVALSVALVLALHFLVFHPAILFNAVGDSLAAFGRPTKLNKRKLRSFYGWEELAAHVSRQMAEMNAKHPTFIISPHNTVAGQLAFLTDKQYDTYMYSEVLPDGRRIGQNSPNVISYLFWQDLNSEIGHNALYVTHQKDDEAARRFGSYFQSWKIADEIPVLIDGQEVRRHYIYLGEHFRGMDPEERPLAPSHETSWSERHGYTGRAEGGPSMVSRNLSMVGRAAANQWHSRRSTGPQFAWIQSLLLNFSDFSFATPLIEKPEKFLGVRRLDAALSANVETGKEVTWSHGAKLAQMHTSLSEEYEGPKRRQAAALQRAGRGPGIRPGVQVGHESTRIG